MLTSLFSLAGGALGRLSPSEIQHGPIILGGQLSVILGGLFIVGLITFLKRWRWLYREWLTTTDHKKIGVMYIVISSVMLLRGFGDVMLLRIQQAFSVGQSHGVLDSDHFQQIFSAHGTIMIFFVGMGFMFGIVNLILPLQIGARDVAFPVLNSISFWLFAAGFGLINMSLLIGEFSAAGWLAYPPLSELAYSPGTGIDYWIWTLQIAGIGSTLSGVNFLTTIIKMRAPGMTLMKMPIFVWTVFGAMLLVIFSFPILTVTLALLSLDRTIGMHIFTASGGGNPMMYVNLIWAWGHPEVYILILPAFGVYSEVVATFSKKRLFGYTSMVYATMSITLLAFLVWLHHFFTMGGGSNVNAFFGIMTMVIAVPTGVKVFNWLFTMYRGRIYLSSPMLWFLGFVVTFTIGGMAGVLMAVPPADFQLHNSLFLVAHFHTMIVGGVLYGYFAGLTYWFPKIFGFKLNERLGKLAVYLWLVGFVLAFVPLYILGLMGATRRLDHYDASLGWQGLFIVAGIGALFIGAGIFMQVAQLAVSIWQRKDNRDITGDPWDGRTLEWATPSPAPIYNFAVQPIVTERDAWWAAKQAGEHLKKPHYEDILLPKNTFIGPLVAAFAFGFGFSVVFHIYWLAGLAVTAIVISLIVRSTNDDTEYTISAAEVEHLERAAGRSYS